MSTKIAKIEDDRFGEDDELDEIGTAALEQYELTQRTPADNRSPTPVSDPILDIPISHPTPVSTSSTVLGPQARTASASLGRSTSSWHNPYREAVSSAQVVEGKDSLTAESSEDHCERIRQLQEQNFTKDGEVKVLRGEKERLMGELRKKDEQMNSIQTKLLSEKRTKEEEMIKERDTLATKLQFKDQELQVKEQEVVKLREELAKLREKLEQRHKAVNFGNTPLSTSAVLTPKAMPGGGPSHHSRSTPTSRPEFLSTETFMPLSQMNTSNVTPVQVGQKRGAVAVKEEQREAPRKTTRRSSKSPSISPGSCSGGPAAHSSRHGDSMRSAKGPSLSSHESERPRRQEKGTSSRRLTTSERYPRFVLEVPKREPTGAQLLMMLVQCDLLKIPSFQRPMDLSQDSISSDSQGSQSSTDSLPRSVDSTHHQKLTGLLSLLHLETASRSSSSMPHFSSGESAASQSSEEHSSSMSESSIPPVLCLNGPGTPTATATPARRSKLHLTKPHTLARTDFTRARTQQHQPSVLVKSLSASNSPYRDWGACEGHNQSSLVSSINKKSLEGSIAALLRSADTSMETSSIRFGSDIRPFSSLSVGSFQPGGSHDSIISLLKQIGDIICQYYNEQLSKAQASSSNISGILTDFGSEHLDSSCVSSPKSSIGTGSTVSSKTSSDLTSPLEGDQQLATQALEILETLVTYSKPVREQILMQPPEFHIDSRPSSALDINNGSAGEFLSHLLGEKIQVSSTHLSPTTQNLIKASSRLGTLQTEAMTESSPARDGPPSNQVEPPLTV